MKISRNDFEVCESQIHNEICRLEHRQRRNRSIATGALVLTVLIAAVLIVGSVWLPYFYISDDSMNPNLHRGEIVIGYKTENLQRDDIVAYDQGGKAVFARVIAVSGDRVNQDDLGSLSVNGEIIASGDSANQGRGDYPLTVPDDGYFVLCDNRSDYITEDRIAAKILFCVWPLRHAKVLNEMR